MKKLLFALLISGCLALCSAGTVYDNLAYDSGTGDWVQNCVVTGTTCVTGTWGPLYNSFTSSPAASTVSDLVLTLSLNPNTDTTTTGSATVDLFADSGSNTPGAFIQNIGTVTDAQLQALYPGIPAQIDLSGLSLALGASTQYWIGLTQVGTSETDAIWEWANNDNGIGTQNEYFSNGTGTFPSSAGPYIMKLSDDYTPPPPPGVPEPAAGLLVGGALLALGLGRRRKTAK